MTIPNHGAHPEHLLQHVGWIRRLARRLVSDAARAEDLSQRTLLRALEHPPRTDGPIAGWLATVMRNEARQEERRDGRRTDLEHRVARGEAQDSSLELVEKVATQRELVEAVLELEEPCRTTVILRYFEECPPRRIAAKLGVPVSTVKTRLARALEHLRNRLDRRHGGDGRTGLLALAPLTKRPEGLLSLPSLPSLPSLSLGAAAVNAKILIGLILLSVAGTLAVMISQRDGAEPKPAVAAEPTLAAEDPSLQAVAPIGQDAERVVVARQGAALGTVPGYDAATSDPAAAPALMRGRVIDVYGTPVSGVQVRHTYATGANDWEVDEAAVENDLASVVTGQDGRFAMVARRGGKLAVGGDDYTTVLLGRPVTAAEKEAVIVVARRISLSGYVIDEAGLPVRNATVGVLLPEDFRASFGEILDFSENVRWKTETDGGGFFEIDDAPRIETALLRAAQEGFVATQEPAPQISRTDLVVVLARPALQGHVLRGRVVDAAGAPVEDARVSLSVDTTSTDGEGLFSFDLAAPHSFNAMWDQMSARFGGDPLPRNGLLAVKRGHLPAEFQARRHPQTGKPLWPEFVTLRLGVEPFAIAGTVVGEDGEPQEGIRVWVSDPTFFGGMGDPSSGDGPDMVHMESLLAGVPGPWSYVETDDRGRFRLEGLLDRDYAIEAMDEETLLRAVVADVPAGREHVVVTMPESEVYPVLRGTVVGHDGRPIEGVFIRPMCDSFRMRVQGQVVGTRHSTAAGTTTDPNGLFRLESVPKDLVYLRIDGQDTVPIEWGRHVEGGLYSMVGEEYDDVVITVGRRCHFQVELADPLEADQIAMLDANGEVLEISEFIGNSRREGPRADLHEGRSSNVAVSDAAVTLVLYLDHREVRRAAIQLTPGERVTIRQ
ncbi:MAG: sigma-70 family RNA polymerase sigma factor [Planctomycetota bacterium]|nr:sigma-70 family RNA polymerase sigma factor [Planctomycetota bacterium]